MGTWGSLYSLKFSITKVKKKVIEWGWEVTEGIENTGMRECS